MIYFITGTDTDVGKSFITAALAVSFLKKGIKLGVQKWISTGAYNKSLDIEYIKETVLNGTTEKNMQNVVFSTPYTFSFPASPHLSARLENKNINKEKLFEETSKIEKKCDILLIEGIGGLMVPINEKDLLIDLIKDVNCPVILVARSGLGTINHTLLSVEALKHSKIELKSIVFNDIGFSGQRDTSNPKIKEDNKKIIEHFSKKPVFGPIPYGLHPWSPEVQREVEPVLDYLLER